MFNVVPRCILGGEPLAATLAATTLSRRKEIFMFPAIHRLFLLTLFLFLLVPQSHGQTSTALPHELEKVRTALEKYNDPIVAVRDGYLSTVGCIAYPSGGMGVHFLNPSLISPNPDPMKPQILLYEPDGDKLRLVGAEWFVPLATGVKERPQLFGHPFDGPMEGHEPLLPAELHHYDLHVWLFKPNPTGMFTSTNPSLKCPARGYSFLEEPTKMVSPH